MHIYSVYGLRLLSDTPLPEVEPGPGVDLDPVADVTVRLSNPRPRSSGVHWSFEFKTRAGQPWLLCGRAAGGYLLRFPELADFWIEAQNGEGRVELGQATASPAGIRHLLLDHVLPRTLALLGEHALHATSVLTPQGAVALVGPSGSGKSSLAAALGCQGALVLGDDCLSLRIDGAGVTVRRGYPGVRLWGDSRVRLGLPEGQPLPHSPTKQRVGAGAAAFGEHPLVALYLLEWKDRVRILGESARRATMALMGNSILLDPADPRQLEAQLRFCSRVAERVPVRRLILTDDEWCMPEAARLLLARARRTPPSPRGRRPEVLPSGGARRSPLSPRSPRTRGRHVARSR